MENYQRPEFLFHKINYKILLIGIAVIALGFVLMSGGGSEDPKVFSEAIFNFQRIRLAPTMVLAGFGITIYSILKNPASKIVASGDKVHNPNLIVPNKQPKTK